MKKWIALVAIGALTLGLLAANYLGFLKPSGSTLIGKPLESTSLVDLSGNAHSVDELKGSPKTVYFWATWCNPCLKTLSAIAHGRHPPTKHDLVSIAIEEDPQAVKAMVDRIGFKGKALVATEGMRLLQVRYAGNDRRALPYVVELDANGRIVSQQYGL